MRVVDEVILARLANAGIDIHDGEMQLPPNDGSLRVITYKMPYAVYRTNVGDDDNRRLSGRSGRRSVYFTITYVGVDRTQTKWLGEKVRDLLQERHIPIPGHRSWLCRLEESQRIWRDDEATRPDGSPIFYGVDAYALSITLTHQESTHV